MSSYSAGFTLGIVTQLVTSTSQLVHGTPPGAILAELSEPMSRWQSEHPELEETLRPISSLLPPANGEIDREYLARALRQTGANLSPISREMEVQLLHVVRVQLETIIQEARPSQAPHLLAPHGPQEVSQDMIQRQMAETLKILVAGVTHDSNNMLAALIYSREQAEEELVNLEELAEKNRLTSFPEISERYLASLRTLQRNLCDIKGFSDMTVKLVREMRLVAGLTGESAMESVDLPQLFREGGIIQRVSMTLLDLMTGLQDAGRDLAELNRMADQYGHLAAPETRREGSRLRGNISECLATLQDMASLIGDLFGILRSVAERLGPANLHRHLSQRLVGAIMGKGVALVLDLDPEPWMIPGPAVSVWQVGMNLMVNARDAMAEKGRLNIKTRRTTLLEEDLQKLKASLIRSTPQPGEYMVLQVQDNGTGIPANILPRIFDLAFSGKKSSGVGLAVTLKIIEEMGGFITVDTEAAGPDRGTTISVYFPRVREIAPVTKMRPKLLPGKEVILIVDDEPSMIRAMKRMLEPKGYQTVTAMDGEAAVEACRAWYADENRPAVSLMLLDLNMPGLRGMELVNRLREIDPGMACLFQSGMAGLPNDLRDIERSSFVEKPSPLDTVIRRMRSLIDVA